MYIPLCTPFITLAVSFDELGLTDNKNPFGLISFLHPFIDLLSSGKWVNNKAKDDIIWPREGWSVILCCRKKRSIADPKLDPESIHGGERAFLYQVNFITLPILCQYLTLSQSKVANIILPPGPRQISDFECVEEEKRQSDKSVKCFGHFSLNGALTSWALASKCDLRNNFSFDSTAF